MLKIYPNWNNFRKKKKRLKKSPKTISEYEYYFFKT